VREDSLHRLALQLGLPEVLRLSDGEMRGGGASVRRSWPTRWKP
jgi:ribonuclease-3